MKDTSWGISLWRPEAGCTHCRLTDWVLFLLQQHLGKRQKLQRIPLTSHQQQCCECYCSRQHLVHWSKYPNLKNKTYPFPPPENLTPFTPGADVFWIDRRPWQRNPISECDTPHGLSFYRQSNVWPGNEGTGGRRQQTLDAKQPLVNGSRKSQADKQTE